MASSSFAMAGRASPSAPLRSSGVLLRAISFPTNLEPQCYPRSRRINGDETRSTWPTRRSRYDRSSGFEQREPRQMLCLGIRNRSATRHLYVAEIPTFLLCYNRPESSLYVRFSQDKGQARAIREVTEAVRKGSAYPLRSACVWRGNTKRSPLPLELRGRIMRCRRPPHLLTRKHLPKLEECLAGLHPPVFPRDFRMVSPPSVS